MPAGSNEPQNRETTPIVTSVESRISIDSGYVYQNAFPPGFVSERIVYISVPSPQASPDKSGWGEPATFIAFLALIVSIGVPIYTWWKDKSDKKKSIEDDYWLRQVVGPIAIEPLLKDVIAMIGSTPDDISSSNFSLPAIHAYHQQNVKMLAALAVNANSLQIINSKLAERASKTIDDIQDLLIDYCYQNETMHSSGAIVAGYERDVFQDAVRTQLVNLAAVIRKYQEKKIVN